jgi:hypothetical protein
MKELYKDAEIDILMLGQKEDIYCIESDNENNYDPDPGWGPPTGGNQ